MRHSGLDIIRKEHRALSAMLRSMQLVLGDSRRRGRLPSFEALRAMIYFVDSVPEKLHHPKESLYLFPQLRGRAPDMDAVLDRLERDHANGERAIRELEHQLLAFEMAHGSDETQVCRLRFEASLDLYVRSYIEHMTVEELRVLPFAVTTLSAEDWTSLDEAFAANGDALIDTGPNGTGDPLLARIVTMLRQSGHIGSALEAFTGIATDA